MPPNVRRRWDDNDWWTQEVILAYCAGRDIEEQDFAIQLAGAKNA